MRSETVVSLANAIAWTSASRLVGIRAETVSTRCSRESMVDLFRDGGYGATAAEGQPDGNKKSRTGGRQAGGEPAFGGRRAPTLDPSHAPRLCAVDEVRVGIELGGPAARAAGLGCRVTRLAHARRRRRERRTAAAGVTSATTGWALGLVRLGGIRPEIRAKDVPRHPERPLDLDRTMRRDGPDIAVIPSQLILANRLRCDPKSASKRRSGARLGDRRCNRVGGGVHVA